MKSFRPDDMLTESGPITASVHKALSSRCKWACFCSPAGNKTAGFASRTNAEHAYKSEVNDIPRLTSVLLARDVVSALGESGEECIVYQKPTKYSERFVTFAVRFFRSEQ